MLSILDGKLRLRLDLGIYVLCGMFVCVYVCLSSSSVLLGGIVIT